MNDHRFDRTGSGPAPSASGAAEEIFESLLEQFDAASAEGATPTAEPGQTLPAEMRGELRELQECLALLNQAARQGVLNIFDASSGSCGGDSTTGDLHEDRSFVGERIGRFELLREIGRGGYGIVFLSRDTEMDRDVALKLPRPEALVAPELRRRFIREAQAAGRLNHPHILPVFEVGEDGGLCYLVTPYCRGPSLAQWLAEQQGPVDVRAAANLIAALAEGLHQAHQLQVLHRDIKPGNVLLDLSATEHPPAGARLVDRPLSSFVPKLTDFGLAKLLEVADQDTRTGAHLGTPAYMAPEAAAGHPKDVGASADIYALGAILYELLVRKPPHTGASDAETLRLALTADPVPPRQLRPKLPRDLEAVVLKCLEKAPRDRYASAGELAADLRRFLAGESTLVRPTGPVRRSWKAIRRRPAVAALLLLAGLLTLALGTGVKLYSLRLAREQRTRTEQQYFRDIRTAVDNRRDGVTERARELLDKYAAPATIDDDPRGFEWYWLNHSLDDQALVIPTGHGEVYGVTYSPDGNQIYSGGQDGNIRIWNSQTGAAEGELRGHTNCVNQVAFTPDGSRLISSSCDKTARIWDVANGKQIGPRLEHASVVLSQAIAHHHPWLATGCEDGHARIWDISTGALLSDLKLAEPHNNVDAVEFSADDQVLAATAGQAGTVVWTTEDWSEMERIGAHSLSLTFCGIEQHLILGNGFDRQITRWDFRQTNNLQFLHRFPTNVYCLRSASESPFFVAGGGAVHVLMENGLLSRVLPGSGGRVQGLAFSPHDRRLAGACFDGNVRCWDLSFDLPSLLFESHNASKVMLSPQSPWIIVVDNAFGMLVFDKRSGRESAQRPSILPLLTSPNGNYVVAHSPPEQKFHLLQLPSAETIAILESEKNTIACAFSHDEKTLAMSDVDGTTRIYDIPSCTIRNRWQLPIEFWEKSNSLALSDDGALLMCHFQWTIDTRTGKRTDLPADLSFLSRSASHPAIRNYSPDGRLRSSIEDVEGVVLLMIRNTLTNELLHAIHHKDSLAGLHCWSPDGKRIAAITASHDLVLFDPVGGSQVAELDRPPASIASLHFEDDGQTLKALAIGKGRLEWFVWKAPRDAPVKTARAK